MNSNSPTGELQTLELSSHVPPAPVASHSTTFLKAVAKPGVPGRSGSLRTCAPTPTGRLPWGPTPTPEARCPAIPGGLSAEAPI